MITITIMYLFSAQEYYYDALKNFSLAVALRFKSIGIHLVLSTTSNTKAEKEETRIHATMYMCNDHNMYADSDDMISDTSILLL